MTVIDFKPAWWLPGPHLQTMWGRWFRPVPTATAHRERWDTPDGDFVDVYRVKGRPGAPRLLVLHGLEGGVRSHYARAMLAEADRRGWSATLLIFRSCGVELNNLPRFYHSGDTDDVRMALNRLLAEESDTPLLAAGVSLGGNVLLRLLGEEASAALRRITAAAAISVPFDLARSARQIQSGFARVYQRHFLRSLRRKALAKLSRFAGIYDGSAVGRATTLYDFDDLVTAPVHGFRDASDYYTQASSLPILSRIRVPTLLVSAVDDPFLPGEVLDDVREQAAENKALELLFVRRGGHVGFVTGTPWKQTYWAEAQAFRFFDERLAADPNWTAVARQTGAGDAA
jgi:uncharacterized protein